MISNQILQSTIDGLKSITRCEFSVIDTDGKVPATTSSAMHTDEKDILSFASSPADSQEIRGCQFFKIYDDQQLEYILVTSGTDDAYMVGKLAAFQLANLLVAYKERFDKDNFIKNLLLDNLLLVDIYNRSKKLHINTEAKRSVMLVETNEERDANAIDSLRNFMGTRGKDFVTAVDEKDIIIVKELENAENFDEIEKCAKGIQEFFAKEGRTHIRISYGTVVGDIKEVSRSYKEAKMALDVGKIFFDDREIVAYSSLGIGRLIYQLPIQLCKMFIM